MHPQTFSDKVKNSVRVFLTGVFGTGSALFFGFLFFSCALALSANPIFAAIAFVFGSLVDIKVYWDNVNNFFKKFFNKNYLVNGIIKNYLEECIEDSERTKKKMCDFLEAYKYIHACIEKLLKEIHELEADIYDKEIRLKSCPSSLNEDETKIFNKLDEQLKNNIKFRDKKRIDLLKHKRKLHRLEKYFKAFVFEKINKDKCFDGIDAFEIKKMIQKKILTHRLFQIANFFAQIGIGIFGIVVVKESLPLISTYLGYLGITLSVTLMTLTIYSLAFVGATVYFMSTYNAIIDMIKENTFKRLFKKFEKEFLDPASEKNFKHYAYMTGILLLAGVVIAIGITATIATAGTWWRLAKASTGMVPYINVFINWFRVTVIPFIAFTLLAFNFKNTLNTIKNFSFSALWTKIKNFFTPDPNINAWQRWNPFRWIVWLISGTFNEVCMEVHLVSVATSGEGAGKAFIPLTYLNERLVDSDYIFEKEGHACDSHDHDDGHGHSHFNPLKIVLFPVIAIPAFIRAVWDYLAALKNLKIADSGPHRLTFLEALKRAFGKTPPVKESCQSEEKSTVSQGSYLDTLKKIFIEDKEYRLNKRVQIAKEAGLVLDKTIKELQTQKSKCFDENTKQYDFTKFDLNGLSNEGIKIVKECFEVANDPAYQEVTVANSIK